jgi:DNA/RNA endonuclease YhcR with UshA esterase domain
MAHPALDGGGGVFLKGHMNSLPSIRVLLGLLTLSALMACGNSTPEPSKSTPVTQARTRDNGTQVTVEGYVSVRPGAFVSAMGNEGFALQDTTGGIYVKLAEKLGFGEGAHVRVTGTLNEEAGLRILESEPASVETLEGTQPVSAKEVGTGSVQEPVEGLLVRVSATVTQAFVDDSPYGYKLYVDDGSGEVQVFVHVSAGFDPATLRALKVGQQVQVTGFAAQYETVYEVAPRQPSDLVAR